MSSEAPASAADAPAGALPYTGASAQSDGAQALLLTPTPVADAAVGGTVSGASDTTALVWMMLLAIMAIPGLIIMTLIATVLIRR